MSDADDPWRASDCMFESTPRKDGVTIRHLPSGASIHIDRIEAYQVLSMNIDVTMGTSPAAQEAVLVDHAWRKWRDLQQE